MQALSRLLLIQLRTELYSHTHTNTHNQIQKIPFRIINTFVYREGGRVCVPPWRVCARVCARGVYNRLSEVYLCFSCLQNCLSCFVSWPRILLCICACAHTHTYTHTNMHLHTHIHTYTRACMHACTSLCALERFPQRP